MRRAATVVLVLAVFLGVAAVVIDRVVVGRVEDQLLERAAEHLDPAPGSDVTIDGFPFLTQVLAGRLAEVRGTAPSLAVEGRTLEDVRVAARGVQPSEPYTAETVEINAHVPVATLQELVSDAVQVPGADVGLAVADGLLRLGLEVAGVELTVALEPSIDDTGAIALRLGEIELGAAQAPVWLTDTLDDLLGDVRIEIPGLPEGLVPTRIAVTDAGLQVRLEGSDVELAEWVE